MHQTHQTHQNQKWRYLALRGQWPQALGGRQAAVGPPVRMPSRVAHLCMTLHASVPRCACMKHQASPPGTINSPRQPHAPTQQQCTVWFR